MEQPRSLLCRKLERNFIDDENFEDFDYNWLQIASDKRIHNLFFLYNKWQANRPKKF